MDREKNFLDWELNEDTPIVFVFCARAGFES